MNMSRKRWLLDLGNSRLKVALLEDDGRLQQALAIGHDLANGDRTLLERLAPVGAGDEAWLASVAPDDRTTALIALLERAGLRVERAQSHARQGRLRIAYPVPGQLGVDRYLAMLAASTRDDGPWVIVSAGSALTVDVLAVDGVHQGGLIAPMPAEMRESLARRFAQLDVPEGNAQELASNTADAVASGARAALLGLVERVLRQARESLGQAPTLLIVGGDAALLDGVPYEPRVLAPTLVLEGLAVHALAGDR